MFELLTRAVMEDRERELEKWALQSRALRLARFAGRQPARRGLWPFQRANRDSSAAFTPGHSASTIE